MAHNDQRQKPNCLSGTFNEGVQIQVVTPLENETRSVLSTRDAAFHLNREQQTLRLWAMYENGPIRPLRVNGRLAWPVSELRRLLGEK